MEDTLRVVYFNDEAKEYTVLILVLMEDTLRAVFESVYDRGVRMGLNPCFNGRYS